MKIGFLGGTFNPIHNGHIAMAQKARKHFGLDKVFFLPTGNSYMKQNVTDKELRLKMVCAAIEEIDEFSVCKLEINTAGPSYTSDTLDKLHYLYPEDEIYFIMGEDSLLSIHLWKNFEKIFKLAKLIVACREDGVNCVSEESKGLMAVISEYEKLYNAEIFVMDFSCKISSSLLREKVFRGESVRDEVSPKVEKIIQEFQLYQSHDE